MKTPNCPKCQNSQHVIPIRYGYPGPEMSKEAAKGNIKLGGCCVTFSDDSAEDFDKATSSVAPGESFEFTLEFADPGWYCKKHDLNIR